MITPLQFSVIGLLNSDDKLTLIAANKIYTAHSRVMTDKINQKILLSIPTPNDGSEPSLSRSHAVLSNEKFPLKNLPVLSSLLSVSSHQPRSDLDKNPNYLLRTQLRPQVLVFVGYFN